MATVHLRLDQGYQAVIDTRGLTVLSDEPIADGGTDTGMEPPELLLASLAACAAITCKMYAQRKGWKLESVEINADLTRYKARDYAAYQGEKDVVHQITQRIAFKGELTEEQRTRLLEIAGKCPVHRILSDPLFLVEELVPAEETTQFS